MARSKKISRLFRNILRETTGNRLLGAATKIGNKIAKDARTNASWSARIQESIKFGSVERRGDILQITVSVDLGIAPEAGAFEFGSGRYDPHRRSTYRIEPREADALAFLWDKTPPGPGPKYIRTDKQTGKKIFRYVDHPGVEPRPFVVPAIATNIPFAVKLIRNAVFEGVRVSFRD